MDYSKLTFDNDDKFKRKQFVMNIMNLVDNWNIAKKESDSLVMALDSPWGSGKSYLLNMWRNWLLSEDNKDKNYYVSYYNAWENDDCDNAFIPLVYKLQQMDVHETSIEIKESLIEKGKEFAKACGVALIKDTIKKMIGEETADILSQSFDATLNESAEKFFDEYKKFMKVKEDFTKALSDLIPVDGKLIVFVDELDRCRPPFAIETLEIVKHYFNTQNIVFIFAVDLEQLAHSIKTMYGEGMDSPGYLRRFFDINISIPKVKLEKYIQHISNKYNIENIGIPEETFSRMDIIYNKLSLSLRDIDKITYNYSIFLLFYLKTINNYIEKRKQFITDVLEVYLFFMILKYKYPETYNMIIRGEYKVYDTIDSTKAKLLDNKFLVSDNIGSMLRGIDQGKAHLETPTYIDKYARLQLKSGKISFAEYIEQTLEIFNNNIL